MDQRTLVEGRIGNFAIFLDVLSFCVLDVFFSSFFKQFGFLGILGQPGNHTSRWIRDLWSKGVSLILANFQTFLSFCVLDDFFRFSKTIGFGVFLIHPPMASVLLSASVERCFVSRMRDFQGGTFFWGVGGPPKKLCFQLEGPQKYFGSDGVLLKKKIRWGVPIKKLFIFFIFVFVGISASIRIGQDNQCVMYVGFQCVMYVGFFLNYQKK